MPREASKAKRRIRWQAHNVAAIPHGYQVAVADVNGDGRADILALSSEESIVEWYENPSWRRHPITHGTKKNISLAPLFRPGLPVAGVALAADFSLNPAESRGALWWAMPPRDADSEWTLHWIGEVPTAHRLKWADLNGDGRAELVVAPIVGPGVEPPDYLGGAPLTWFEMPEATMRGHLSAHDTREEGWTQHSIDASLSILHGIAVLDWDGDGRDEILTASVEGVDLFHSSGAGQELSWTKTRLAECAPGTSNGRGHVPDGTGRGASEIGAGKLNGRRYLATIEPWHGEQVAVYFERERGKLWERRVIDSSFKDGHALTVADFDGDGNDEIAAGFRGEGTSLFMYHAADASGAGWERELLDDHMAAAGVTIADLNGDGRPDVVAIGASTANVKWYENLG